MVGTRISQAARIDLGAVFTADRSGEPVVRIAERHAVSPTWTSAR